MYSINPKTITKVTKQRVIVNNSTKEKKWNHKNYSITPEEERQRKKKKGTTKRCDKGHFIRIKESIH